MAEVRFEHVTKAYTERAAVIRDLNLRARDHEFLVLVGPSGCGKTTALRMIAGLEQISEGDVYIGERRVNDIAPRDRDVAMVFQNYALYPHMSVYDNMAFALKLRDVAKSEIDKRVRQAARMLGIGEYLARKPKQLSGGQRQRVALGRALVRDPQVFLLDEPLSNLDAKLRVQTRAEISRLHQATGTTFVYVTHDQVEAMTMGDRIAVMNAGVIQQLGMPQELYDAPTNLFVAGFIGSPAMNFFQGRLTRGAEGSVQVTMGAGTETATLTLVGGAADQAARHSSASDGGRPVIMGIRPEGFSADGTAGGGSTLSGMVDVMEHLGNEQLVYVRLPGALLLERSHGSSEQGVDGDEGSAVVAATSTARLASGIGVALRERITLAVDMAKVHLFDPVTTARLV